MLLLYLLLSIISLLLWSAILKVGNDSDEQMEILMEQYKQSEHGEI